MKTTKGRLGSVSSTGTAASAEEQRTARSEADIDRYHNNYQNRSLSPGKKIKRVSFSSEGGFPQPNETEEGYETGEETPSPESQHLTQLATASTRGPWSLNRTKTVSMLNQIAVGEYCIWEARVTPPTPEEFGEEDSTAMILGGGFST